MIYRHFSDVEWDSDRWPNFSPGEPNIHCPCCGEFWHCEDSFDALQAMRGLLQRPMKINSGHRCAIHNARVGGAPRSYHKRIAFDVSIRGQNHMDVLRAAQGAGFTGYGYYGTFLHVDLGRARFWVSGEAGRKTWVGLI